MVGATLWSLNLPKETDPGRILQSAQQHVFENELFTKPILELDFLDEIDFFTVDDAERKDLIKEYQLTELLLPLNQVGVAGLKNWLITKAEPNSELSLPEVRSLLAVSSSGTHSVLDLWRQESQPCNGALFPLPAHKIESIFGTQKPSEPFKYIIDIDDCCYERGQGVYMTVYENGLPSHIYIEGMTGD